MKTREQENDESKEKMRAKARRRPSEAVKTGGGLLFSHCTLDPLTEWYVSSQPPERSPSVPDCLCESRKQWRKGGCVVANTFTCQSHPDIRCIMAVLDSPTANVGSRSRFRSGNPRLGGTPVLLPLVDQYCVGMCLF